MFACAELMVLDVLTQTLPEPFGWQFVYGSAARAYTGGLSSGCATQWEEASAEVDEEDEEVVAALNATYCLLLLVALRLSARAFAERFSSKGRFGVGGSLWLVIVAFPPDFFLSVSLASAITQECKVSGDTRSLKTLFRMTASGCIWPGCVFEKVADKGLAKGRTECAWLEGGDVGEWALRVECRFFFAALLVCSHSVREAMHGFALQILLGPAVCQSEQHSRAHFPCCSPRYIRP